MNLLLFAARCQNKPIVKQYELGARWFDLRISFDKNNIPEFRHGLVSFKGDVFTVLEYLNTLEGIIVNIVLEKDSELFSYFCYTIENIYTNIRFVGGFRKSDWERIYTFKSKEDYTTISNFASAPDKPKWYGIFPKAYSFFNNKKYKDTDVDYLIMDFIGSFN